MYMLQLFDSCEAVQPIDARLLRDGTILIGRDNRCDWPIADPKGQSKRAVGAIIDDIDQRVRGFVIGRGWARDGIDALGTS